MCCRPLYAILLSAAAMAQEPAPPDHADAKLPSVEDVTKVMFALDGRPPFLEDVVDLLRYRVVDEHTWHHGYSHVAGMDSTGQLLLRDGRALNWMLRPGGLGTLTLPDGRVLYLALDRHPTAVRPKAPASIAVGYQGMDELLRQATKGDAERCFAAVQQLALLRDNEDGRVTLLRLVADREVNATTRDHAAMGLGNYGGTMAPGERARATATLLEVLEREAGAAPTGIVLTLLRFGEGARARAALGAELRDHPFEIELLGAGGDETCRSRLWQLRQGIGRPGNIERYSKLANISRALVGAGDVRGVELGMELLRVRATMMPAYGNNVFFSLAGVIGGEFASAGRPAPTVADAEIERLLAWWEGHRATFALPVATRR